VLVLLAVLGIAGTVGFGLAWTGLHDQQLGETQARAAARSFLVDLTNFDAKTVDADFSAVSAMATGPFASQAEKFFNSAIRQELEQALASSRGQIRALFVQTYGGGQATVYGVVDQLYANDKIGAPRTDVLRVVLTMARVQGNWKVADVTVLQGPSQDSPGSKS
jgi:Mce-associated membrane protein